MTPLIDEEWSRKLSSSGEWDDCTSRVIAWDGLDTEWSAGLSLPRRPAGLGSGGLRVADVWVAGTVTAAS